MKPSEKQIKENTKRLLRNQICSTCHRSWRLEDTWICNRTNALILPVHTCYQYDGVYVLEGTIWIDQDNNKGYVMNDSEWRKLD